jgi:predicted ATPase/DNA-binding SARP family transcriptional activator
VEIRLLGAVEVVDDQGAVQNVRGAYLRTLLVALALRCGEVVASDRLIDTLWGDVPPHDSANALQRHVSSLRRVLGRADLVLRRAAGYVLDADRTVVDALRFEALFMEGRSAMEGGDAPSARSILGEALSLWRSESFPDDVDSPYARADAARLDEERLAAIEARVEADLALGRHADIVADLESLVAQHPFREGLVAQLMRALSASGRQAEALRAFQAARTALIEGLGIEPSPSLRAVEAAVLAHQDAGSDSTAAPPPLPATNLRSPLTSLVGRRAEVAAVEELLAERRLVTLIGTGGAGKTRLALEVARTWHDTADTAVWMVELAEVTARDGVVPAIAAVLDVPDDATEARPSSAKSSSRLTAFLGQRPTLLLLDNCEHLVDEVATCARDLLEACPALRILATSREGLGVTGEDRYEVLPLPLADSVELFAERAGAVAPWLSREALARDDVQRTIEQICASLDGLPLALELAAARLSAMTVEEVAARLDDRFRLLGREVRGALPRQRTLRAVIDWSYDLLSTPERTVFERLSVFAGGWTTIAAAAVCADDVMTDEDVVDILTALTDKSLVQMDHRDTPVRYRMLQTLMHYGRDRLVAAGETERVTRAHGAYFAAMCRRGDAALRGDGQREWLALVGADMDNIRSALQVAAEVGDAETMQAIAGSLGWYWWLTGRGVEGYRYLSAAHSCGGPADPLTRARVLAWTAYLSTGPDVIRAADEATKSADTLLDEALESLRAMGAAEERATIQAFISMMYSTRGQRSRMREFVIEAQESLATLEETPRCRAMRTWLTARRALYEGRYEEAEAGVLASNELLTEVGDDVLPSLNTLYLGRLAILRDDLDTGIRSLERGIAGARALGLSGLADTLTTDLGDALALAGQSNRARAILEDVLARGREIVWLPGSGQALTALAWVERRAGRHAAAVTRARQALAVVDAADNRIGVVQCLVLLGHLATDAGERDEARTWYQRGLDAADVTEDRRARALALEGFAGLVLGHGDGEGSALLLGAAAAERDAASWNTGWPLMSALRGDTNRITAAVRRQLGPDAFRAAYDRARTVTAGI